MRTLLQHRLAEMQHVRYSAGLALWLLGACGPSPELRYAVRAVAIGDEAAKAALTIDSAELVPYGAEFSLQAEHRGGNSDKNQPQLVRDSILRWTSRAAAPLEEARREVARALGDLPLVVPPERLRSVHDAILASISLLGRSATITSAEIAGNGYGSPTTEWNALFAAGNLRRSGLVQYSQARDRLRRLVPGAAQKIQQFSALDSVIAQYPPVVR